MIGSFARRAALCTAGVLVLTAAALPGDVPGAGLGDRLYPELGNAGYDVSAYDISLDYHGNDRPLDAVTRIDALAQDTLPRFDLDFTDGTVRSVEVNGRAARYATEHEELVITPQSAVKAGERLHITVAHTSDPKAGDNGGWIRTPDGLAMANQADAAHRVFPCNDHPSDKARFTFRVTAPEDLTVVANGMPGSEVRRGALTTWTYRTSHVMATELAQVSIGSSAVVHHTGPHGLPLRDVVGADDKDNEKLNERLAMTSGQIDWMEHQVGPFPFETYGILSADTTTGFELETQTLSLFERRVLLAPEAGTAPIMVHELAHQWFGDSVSPAAWSDLWLNEGHATWYQWLYAAEKYDLDLDEVAHDAYRADRRIRDSAGPPAAPHPPGENGKLGIFRPNVYAGAALALYALRTDIGPDAFQRLERAWVSRYRDSSASTRDFILLACEISGRDLTGFLDAWLFGADTPPMPHHPDWESDPPAAPDRGKHA